MSDLWRRSASELAVLIARKEVSSREVVEAHLARIAAVNPKLNAVVKVLAEEARKGATRLTGRSPPKKRSDRCTGSPSRSRRTSIRPARRPRGDCRRSLRPWFRSTRQWSSGCARPGLCRSGGPICRHGAARSHAQFATRRDAQSLECGTDRRRFERRRSGGSGRRHVASRPRQRHRRLAAQSRQRLRHRIDPAVQGRVPDAGVIREQIAR